MSTTLLPPSYYVVKARGQTARVFPTIAQAATAIVQLTPTPATVSAITGPRSRSLTDTELRELGRRVRAHRLRASRATVDRRERSADNVRAIGRTHPGPPSEAAAK